MYRDDGLGVFKSHSGSETKRKRREIIKTFNTYNLSITIETNIRVENFLDTTIDLINNIYKPYHKPNDNPVYINKNLNHPPTVLQQLAKSVSKRISETSSNEQMFKESIPIYEEVLKTSGFHKKLEYVREEVHKHAKEEKKRRKRKIIWFNLPYSNNVKSNVGKQFLRLVWQHFPKVHRLNKIFNKNAL